MKTLESLELAEANAYLATFDSAHSKASSYFGLAVLSAFSFPFVSALFWWLEPGKVNEVLFLFVVMACGVTGLGFWWRTRATRAFHDIKWCAAKLRRAGFPLCWEGHGSIRLSRGFVLVGEGERPIDFENITQKQLYAERHAL